MAARRELTRADVLAMEEYGARRAELRREAAAHKRDRRVAVGPFATFHFESYRTMWHQVHEMLHVEKGGEAQIAGELAAYNPLIPQGSELVATVMFEIDDPARRARFLAGLGGVEHRMSLEVAGARIPGLAETDTERTDARGKASSVHFVRFPLGAADAAGFRAEGARVVLGIDHPGYAHMAVLPEPTRAALAEDLDRGSAAEGVPAAGAPGG